MTLEELARAALDCLASIALDLHKLAEQQERAWCHAQKAEEDREILAERIAEAECQPKKGGIF